MGTVTTAEIRNTHFICVTALYFCDTLRVMSKYATQVARLKKPNEMPSKSLLPELSVWLANTIISAPTMPSTTPTVFNPLIFSPRKSAAISIVAIGQSVAIIE